MLALGLVESGLRFGDRPIAPLALLGFLRELAPALGLTLLPLTLKSTAASLAAFSLIFGAEDFTFARLTRGGSTLSPSRQVGMLRERSVRSGGASQHHARLRHRRGDNVGVVRLPRSALIEKVARAPGLQRRLHEGAAIARS
jgi:hypothetical protein